MLELLSSLWGLVTVTLSSVLELAVLVSISVWDVLMALHVGAPRLEGLLVGVLLAWLLSRRERHPLLKVLSSPLRLVIDILDLVWDQALELVSDAWTVARGWVFGALGLVRDRVVGVGRGLFERVMSVLSSVKDKLSKK